MSTEKTNSSSPVHGRCYAVADAKIVDNGNGYTIECGGMTVKSTPDKLPEFTAMMMQEVHRLRWIIDQADKTVGGSVVFDICESTQADYERVEIPSA